MTPPGRCSTGSPTPAHRCSSRRWTASLRAPSSRSPSRARVSATPRSSPSTTPGSTSPPALAVDRLVRGCTPAPGAWTTFRGERLKVGPVAITHEQLPAGVVDARKREVLVGTADRAVRLGEVTPLGKKPMPAADWARGVRIDADERLGEETA
ncbi:hypothetical protein [Janibacter indicus]|uniref:hypothetical protein n=1 Tax=Janibacter indicus TaxID=857417 RepID=UPI003D9A8099